MKISELKEIPTGTYIPQCSLFIKQASKPIDDNGRWTQRIKLTDSSAGVWEEKSRQMSAEVLNLGGNIPLVKGCEIEIPRAQMNEFTNIHGTFPKLLIENFNVKSSSEPPQTPSAPPPKPSGGRREEKPDWNDINRGKCRSLVIEALIASGQLKINNDFPIEWIARAANVMMTGEDTALLNDAPPLSDDDIPF